LFGRGRGGLCVLSRGGSPGASGEVCRSLPEALEAVPRDVYLSIRKADFIPYFSLDTEGMMTMALYDRLSAVYDRLFPVNPSTFSAIEALIPENAPRRLLDLGAATGGHLTGFQERGWEVLGIEMNHSMVAKAQKGVRVVEGSMLDAEALAIRYFGPDARCGAVLCLGNTLPHLRMETIVPFFSSVRRLTAQGCPFVVQMLNYANPSVGAGFVFPNIVSGDIVFSRRYEAGTGPDSLIFVTDLSMDGVVMTDRTELYPLPPAVLRNELAAVGFDRIDFFSDWNKAAFREDRDLYLIAVAR